MSWVTVRKWWARIGIALWLLFIAWGLIAFQTWGVDPAVLKTSGNVIVQMTESDIRFLPRNPRSAGLLFFPGALVDPEAYAPFLRSIAEAGYPVFLIKLPLRGFATEAAQAEAEAWAGKILSEEGRWIVGGHSKGGRFASHVASAIPAAVDHLLLIGTAHPRELDLSEQAFGVTKIVATRDGLASPDRLRASAHNLPDATRWVVIEGGNHSQFGHYGFQFGDRFAKISRADQQAQVLRAVLADLAELTPPRW
ncbi:MAG TPA: alpha/beta hydrolase [Thermoanaerobaculia bacterium]|nr:alpha/beta hydrolase [Thermoanaerobaculia bacterium]